LAHWVEQSSEIKVYDAFSLDKLKSWGPQFSLINHWPTFQYLQANQIQTTPIFGFLGVLPPAENPVNIAPDSANPYWWAVSEEVFQNVSAHTGWIEENGMIIRNWISPDVFASKPKVDIYPSIRKLLIVSNHFYYDTVKSAPLREYLDRKRIDWEHIGSPMNNRIIDPKKLIDADAIVSIGRTCLDAAHLRVPILVLDYQGSDGWLNTNNYYEIRKSNFSGRRFAYNPNEEWLDYMFKSKPTSDQLDELGRIVDRNHTIEYAVEKLLDRLDIIESTNYKVRLSKASMFVAEQLDHIFKFSDRSNALTQERDALTQERDALTQERDALTQELEEIKKSQTYKVFNWYRRLRM
jgi:hypothetical protein